MALSASSVLQVRTDGSDTNGGGFVTGATGTDWSQQAAAQYAVTDAVTNGSTTITSATANFGTDVVGNLLYIAGGTGAITGAWYQIMTRSSATTITVDRSTGLTTGTGATLNIGGAFLTLAAMLAIMTVSGMTAYVKAGSGYTIGTGLTTSSSPSLGSHQNVIGYTNTLTDGGRVTITASAGITMLTCAGSGWKWSNFIFDANNVASTNGVNLSGTWSNHLWNCIVKNCKGYGVTVGGQGSGIDNCEVTGCATGTAAVVLAEFASVLNCAIHDNTIPGISAGSNSATVQASLIYNNTGASSDGIIFTGGGAHSGKFIGNTIYGNGRDGLRLATYPASIVSGNIFVGNGGYGFNSASLSPARDNPMNHHNAFYNNTSGARNNASAGPGDVTLTGDPFTNAAGGDFSLNSTAGAGAAARAAAFPGALIAGGTGYRDAGALQHLDAGGMLYVPNLEGT